MKVETKKKGRKRRSKENIKTETYVQTERQTEKRRYIKNIQNLFGEGI